MKQITILITVLLLFSCSEKQNQISEVNQVEKLKQKISKFIPVEIQYDENLLSEREKIVLEKLYRASKLIDSIFLDQVYSKNHLIKSELLSKLSDKSIVNNPEEKLKYELQLELFSIMFGPFDRLEDDEPFIGTEKKPLGANFYPEDMTKEEFENWIKQNPDDEKSFTSEFTVIIIKHKTGN